MMRLLEPGCYANPRAFIVASLCTLVLLLGDVDDKRDHVNDDFAHYLGNRRRDGTVIRTFPGDKCVILDKMAINDVMIFAIFWSSPW